MCISLIKERCPKTFGSLECAIILSTSEVAQTEKGP